MKLAIFDMDGTIFESYLDWENIRKQLKIPDGSNILNEIYSGNKIDTQKLKILEEYERDNTLLTKPIEGIFEFITFLKAQNIKTVLLTNNNLENTFYLLTKFKLEFNLVITREMKFWKPEPSGFIYAIHYFRCFPDEVISIGDSIYDIQASKEAGIKNIFIIKNKMKTNLEECNITYFLNYFDLKKITMKKLKM